MYLWTAHASLRRRLNVEPDSASGSTTLSPHSRGNRNTDGRYVFPMARSSQLTPNERPTLKFKQNFAVHPYPHSSSSHTAEREQYQHDHLQHSQAIGGHSAETSSLPEADARSSVGAVIALDFGEPRSESYTDRRSTEVQMSTRTSRDERMVAKLERLMRAPPA
ncbi:hypothetical protein BC835DRAFT_251366 [Cytidiella melzeri]|nr:hypothetical protein BC835DRAFT_251366 [Cytidiella melzeri]